MPNDGHTVYELDADEPVSEGVVEAVAAASEVSAAPRDTSVGDVLDPLYEAVDPDALDDIFAVGDPVPEGQVRFPYCGHAVTVHSEGRIRVERLESGALAD